MGAWDTSPWGNDAAADWFGDLFESTGLRDVVERTLREDTAENHEEIRAAASVLLFLGRIHVWPIRHLDSDLRLAVEKLEEVSRLDLYADPAFRAEIAREISGLRGRLEAG